MTPQEIFDHVATFLIKQGRPAEFKPPFDPEFWGSGCAYVANDGTRCAVGCLMDEEEAHLYGGYHGSVSELTYEAEEGSLRSFFFSETGLLTRLQVAHDFKPKDGRHAWLPSFKAEMRRIASDFNLDPSALDVPLVNT